MVSTKRTVFISYRREGGFETARFLFDSLVRDGYSVTFDIDTLRNGRFDQALLSRIDECDDFIIILNKGCFDRTLDPSFPTENDWIRRELACALRSKKNIIPIMLRGFCGFPDNLPDDIKDVQWMNGPKYDQEYIGYTCKYCGTSSTTIRALVSAPCPKHPTGFAKGKHSPTR